MRHSMIVCYYLPKLHSFVDCLISERTVNSQMLQLFKLISFPQIAKYTRLNPTKFEYLCVAILVCAGMIKIKQATV